ncbi:MAG: GvpL/GvpF family gas vesicle protein [Pseudomonadota bacterium]
MSALLLIGITPGRAKPGTAPVHHRIEGPGWTALALEVDPDAAAHEDTALAWAAEQNQVLSAYVQAVDVLPVPMGAVFSDATSLTAHATTAWPQWSTALKGIQGACEFVLRAEADDMRPQPDPAANGTTYLRQRLTARNDRATLHHRRNTFLCTLATMANRHATATRRRPGGLLCMTLLVRRTASDALITNLSGHASEARALGLSCTLIGPSPAYSFTEQEVACA